MKKLVLTFASVSLVASSFAQNVFTYGKHAVTKEEFVRAFNKNPTAGENRNKALKEYLDLYINFKLKVRVAYDVGLDKDPTQQYELENYRKQVADNIINDEANVKGLVKQAFERSQKEIHLQQVFIEVPQNGDTAEAYKKIHSAFKQLKDGKDFPSVVRLFSSDGAAKQSGGDVGFVTVFTLPYYVENEVYRLRANSFSAPVRTKAGYHIFRNAGERHSSGSRRVAQILIAIPPGATAEDKAAAARKADSIYSLLKSGADFAALASTVSNDLSSSSNRGELPEFSVGTYEADFEKIAFSLKNKGEICVPFQTTYGFHILKLLEAKPTPTDINDPFTFSILQEKVMKDNRLELSKKDLIQKKLTLLKFQPSVVKPDDLYVFTDSALHRNNIAAVKGITENTPLFSFAKQTVKAGDWVKFIKANQNRSYLTTRELYTEWYKEYINAAADEYYRNNLDGYNSDFVKQLKEFKEANLLFGVMEKNVWGKANTDTVGLIQYYNQHKSKYTWRPSADAIVVTCSKPALATTIQQKLKDDVASWRQITSANGTDITVDSGRYELGQLPVLERTNFTPGLITTAVKNQNDDSYTFNYILKVYREPEQRSFDDARGIVISDYQQVLEDKWIAELKRKYPVKVNQAVLQSIK